MLRWLLPICLALPSLALPSLAQSSLAQSSLAQSSVAHSQSSPAAAALSTALHGTHASAIVLDQLTGDTLASISTSPTHPSAPGSVLKPLLLDYALRHAITSADATVYCRRSLRIGTRSLPCTHPANAPLMHAEAALALSCNTWFADLGRRFTGPALDYALTESHLHHSPMATATVDQRELAVLGLYGVQVTPLDLARAYRQLLLHTPPDGPVLRGLTGSVQYGMANQAAVPGLTLIGKTGTASDPGQTWTHGWFAGALAAGDMPGNLILVIYVPHGDGGTAALLAHHFFREVSAGRSAK